MIQYLILHTNKMLYYPFDAYCNKQTHIVSNWIYGTYLNIVQGLLNMNPCQHEQVLNIHKHNHNKSHRTEKQHKQRQTLPHVRPDTTIMATLWRRRPLTVIPQYPQTHLNNKHGAIRDVITVTCKPKQEAGRKMPLCTDTCTQAKTSTQRDGHTHMHTHHMHTHAHAPTHHEKHGVGGGGSRERRGSESLGLSR